MADAFRHTGVEGLVVKGASSRYESGKRSWIKYKTRGDDRRDRRRGERFRARPEVVVTRRYRGKELEVCTVPLNDRQAAEPAPLLKPAGVRHPWPDEIGSGRWGAKGAKVPLVKVRPRVVIEVAADAAMQADQHRHPLRYVRYRADLQPEDVRGA